MPHETGEQRTSAVTNAASLPHIHAHWLFYFRTNDIDAALAAASTVPVRLPLDTARDIAIVFPSYAQRVTLAPVTAPWMSDLLWRARLRTLPVDSAGVADLQGHRRLVLFTSAAPGTLPAARLIAAAREAMSAAPSLAELETSVVSAAEVAGWRRAAADVPPSTTENDNGPSDARWFWLAALVLMLVELRLRRTSDSPATLTEERARAA